MHFYALKPRNGKKINLSYAFDPKIEGISSAVSKFTMHPFDGRKALKIMREDIDAVLHQHRNLHHPGHLGQGIPKEVSFKFLVESLKGTKKQDMVAPI